ncbi:MAG: hypothetical protein GMKNLPBB_02116 [Myxococcota bacterium]|nr:hypothetical protein [Myxococcota bacterium]
MLHGQVIAVVVPAHDEAAHIGAVIASMPAFVDHILVVDDASADATAEIAGACGDARIRLTRHAANLGPGAAIATGYRQALMLGADYIAVMAGDGQMDPDDLRPLVETAIARGGYVKGNRFLHPRARDMPLWRKLGGMAVGGVTTMMTRQAVSDTQCGYTVIDGPSCQRLITHGIWSGYGYPNDILMTLDELGIPVSEAPVRPVFAGQKSGITPARAGPLFAWTLVRLALRHGKLFLAIGVLAFWTACGVKGPPRPVFAPRPPGAETVSASGNAVTRPGETTGEDHK